jgi:hypothetical protein
MTRVIVGNRRRGGGWWRLALIAVAWVAIAAPTLGGLTAIARLRAA